MTFNEGIPGTLLNKDFLEARSECFQYLVVISALLHDKSQR